MLFDLLRGNLDFTTALIQVLAILVIVFLVLPFHEWAHAFTASKLGDTSIKYRGRLTLNPMAHIDPIGALALLLFGFGWAKPVPINARNFKKPKAGMAIVALMGPVANVVAAIVGGLIFHAIAAFSTGFFPMVQNGNLYSLNVFGYYLYIFLQFYIQVNCALAVFNLIPIPPLDGSKVLFAFLPDRIVEKFYQYQQIISIILIVLIFSRILSYPLSWLTGQVVGFVDWLTALPFSFVG